MTLKNDSPDLTIAIAKLVLQKEEIEQQAAQLIIANEELLHQNEQSKKKEEALSVAINELKETEARLKVVNEELEAFSYSVSHDLRAPLRAISGYSNILKEDFGLTMDPEANRIIDVITHNAQLMSDLIDNLLSFSRTARLEVVSDAVNMQKLAETVIAELLQTGNHSALSIKIDMLPACKGDASMLKQVWYNLLDNAIKYSSTKTDPQIEIGYTHEAFKNVYYVKDNGVGFDMKYVSKLFGVFQRLHRHDEFEGTGLGLALVKRIVTKHDGEIWVEASVQHGATFCFSIPK